MIRFTIPAIPVAQPRQRHRVVHGIAMNYTPAKHPANEFKASARLAFAHAYQGAPLQGPLRFSASFIFPRPKSLTWKSKPMPRVPHTGRNDLDNLVKCLADGLNGIAWKDDAQICEYRDVQKWIASGDEQPHVEVTIEQIQETTRKESP